MLERYARLPIDSPRPIIVVVVLLTLIACPLILDVEFATDVQAFLPQSDEVETYDKITERFGQDSSLVNLYITSVDGGNVLTMPHLADILALHQDSSEISGVKDVLSVAGFFDDALRDSGTSLDEVNSEKCFEYEDSNSNGKYDSGEICYQSNWDEVWDSIKASNQEGNYTWDDVDFVLDVLVNRNMDMNNFVLPETNKTAPTANSTIIMINLDPDLTTQQKKEIGQEIRILADNHNYASGSDIQAEAFSVHLLAYDVDESTRETNLLMAIGMLVVTVVLLWLSFRHWSYVILPLITLVISVIWTFAFGVLMGITFTAIDVAVVPLVVGLGIDFSVHISRRYQEGINAGNSVEESLLDSQIHTGRALSLAVITTIIAFLSGVSAGVGPVRDFSLLCAAGIFSSFILTILFYTSLRYVLDSRSEQMGSVVSGSELIEDTISRASELVDKHPQAIVSTVVIITLLAIGGASQISTSFTLDDFLSDDLEIMVTGENIQNDFRGASYSQSQILIEGPIATTNFLDGLHEFKAGEQGGENKGLNDDRYTIQVGAEARLESVHELVQKAVDSEQYNVAHGNNSTHAWILTNLFEVILEDVIIVSWNTEQSLASPTLEVTIFWYDQENNEIAEKLYGISLESEISSYSAVSTTVPPEAERARVQYSYILDNSTEPIIYGSAVHDSKRYIYVQSLKHTFNLTYESKSFSKTTDSDVKNLYDYLYQRDLDIADPFTDESYSDKIRHVLHRDANGQYTSSVIRVFIGPDTVHELDNDGLEFMRAELKADIPSSMSDYTISFTGGHVLTSVTVNEIQSTQVSSTLTSIVLAIVILLAIYRNFGMAILATVPTVLATVWIMATMTVLGITLNVLTVMVTALTIGLGIDYAIHIVERFREEIEHKSERQAIQTTIERTGSALLISGLTTVCGFAVLFLSPMPLVRNFGIITAATIIYSVTIAIFVLPSLIWTSNRIKEWYSSQTLD
ncbi:MAG: efflux RND transporter permease subunit [Candidatus Thermoplasmatota archaeon]|nr:efflux RND transporter permease subunit [Candidatus Thermoplasmatota archaeon]